MEGRRGDEGVYAEEGYERRGKNGENNEIRRLDGGEREEKKQEKKNE